MNLSFSHCRQLQVGYGQFTNTPDLLKNVLHQLPRHHLRALVVAEPDLDEPCCVVDSHAGSFGDAHAQFPPFDAVVMDGWYDGDSPRASIAQYLPGVPCWRELNFYLFEVAEPIHASRLSSRRSA